MEERVFDVFRNKVAVRHRGADRDKAVKEVTQVLANMARAFPDASVARSAARACVALVSHLCLFRTERLAPVSVSSFRGS